MFQEVTWRAWKNFLHFRKINLLPSSLKTPVFFKKTLLGFYHCFFGCFHFFMFSFPLHMFLLMIAFVYFTVSSLLFLLRRVLPIWERIFYSKAFCTLHSFLLLSSFPSGLWRFQTSKDSKHRPICKLDPSVCLNHTIFGNYIISRKLCLNLSKYVDKLLVAKSLINFKHIS